jgi:hypothetical protein
VALVLGDDIRRSDGRLVVMNELYEYTVSVSKRGSFTVAASSIHEALVIAENMDSYELDKAATWEEAEFDCVD